MLSLTEGFLSPCPPPLFSRLSPSPTCNKESLGQKKKKKRKENNYKPRVLYSVKQSFIIEELKKFMINRNTYLKKKPTKPALQKILKGILHT
jgi:hypothetical protein